MKNIKAIGIAFIMFAITVGIVNIAINRNMPEYNLRYGTWINDNKFSSNAALKKLASTEKSMVVFGSSELKHCQKSGFHGDSIYKNKDMKPVFIGRGGYQSLNHAITLGALADELKNKKVVISVSPQWFKPAGVQKEAFGASYSETNMIAFLRNKEIPESIKKYVISRLETLTTENPVMWKRIQDDVNWYMYNNSYGIDILRKQIHSCISENKARTKLFVSYIGRNIGGYKDSGKEDKINWDKLYKKASRKGRKQTGHNEYGMLDRVFDRQYKKRVANNDILDLNYKVNSIEFQDLQCFLDICKTRNIEVLMIMQPLNGRWSDYANYPTEKRQALYASIRELAEKNHVQIADMTGLEYEKYIFEDSSHLALKGLVNFNEQIYKFYKQSEK